MTVVRVAGMIGLLVLVSSCGDESSCTNGRTRCSGSLLVQCTGGTWTTVSDCSQLDEICREDPASGQASCQPGENACNPGESRCTVGVVQICQSGEFVDGQNCADDGRVCVVESSQAKCILPPECTETESRCLNNTVQACNDGFFVNQQDCTPEGQICEQNQESDEASCVEPPCTSDATRCLQDVIQACQQDTWVNQEDCGELGQVCRLDPISGQAGCFTAPCPTDARRCENDTLQKCDPLSGEWVEDVDCSTIPAWCVEDTDRLTADCQGLEWIHLKVTIDDEVYVGSSVNMPTDNPAFALDPVHGQFVTRYHRNPYEPEEAPFLWLLDGQTGSHTRWSLSGELFAPDENFCQGEEWCQFVGFDSEYREWIVAGVSASNLLRVDEAGAGSLTAVTGNHPPDSWINHSHRFVPSTGEIWLYGATGPSGFGDRLFRLDTTAATWNEVMSGLPQVNDNCLAVDTRRGHVYSFGGRTTSDGGETTATLQTYLQVDPVGQTTSEQDLPVPMGPRRAMACAYDRTRDWIYVFGGSRVVDRYNEIDNEYHNDLWVLDLTGNDWALLSPDGELGEFEEPDSYGDRRFVANVELPNFGKNRCLMIHDATSDRLVVAGEVPVFPHGQMYFLDLTGVEELLTP